MRHLISILLLCVGILTSANAQTFTQRIQKKMPGQGSVVIHQSDSIDQLVNTVVLGNKGAKPAVPSTAGKPATPSTADKPAAPSNGKSAVSDQPASSNAATASATNAENGMNGEQAEDAPKIVHGSYKVMGYRVQAFAGGNSRADRQKAEATRNNIKAHFPNVPVYVHFFSPRWICRVGNYRTYEEAHQMAASLKSLGFNQCTIVKGKIQVAY